MVVVVVKACLDSGGIQSVILSGKLCPAVIVVEGFFFRDMEETGVNSFPGRQEIEQTD